MLIQRLCFALTAFLATGLFAQTNAADVPQLVSAKKIWNADKHNAFTDLIRFQDKWFCTFRESAAHVGGNGKIRVLVSKDGEQWESAALLSEEGIDLRDPKLSIMPDGRLMLVLGGSVYEGKTLKERQSRTAFSKDGYTWTSPRRVLEKGDWLWRVTWNNGVAYGIAYTSVKGGGMTVKLVSSKDGVNFQLVTNLDVPAAPNESTLRFRENGECIALVRREAEDKQAWIGHSFAPYKDWKWHPAAMQIGGPNFLLLPDGKMIASGRKYGATSKDAKTFVGKMALDLVLPELILPSGGDCSYAGMAMHEGLLWLSYYSSHEDKTSIYLAKVKLPKTK
ncbi:MAG: hypothetical protein JWM68_3889 [Verrucomicrobiales bacterium]|nr:hypothetical protein [Verrucomicrobiales bacterium]